MALIISHEIIGVSSNAQSPCDYRRKRPSKKHSILFVVANFVSYKGIRNRFLFKKWLDLEKKLGDAEGVETVKAKAIEWTQNAAASGGKDDE